MKKFMFLFFSFFFFYSSNAQLDFDFTEVATGFTSPVDIAHDGFNEDRLYIVERGGAIKLMEKVNGNWVTNGINFLDVTVTTNDSGGDERGLLGLVFHPDFENNGYFYVNYTLNSGGFKTFIDRYTVIGNGEVADINSKFPILNISQQYSNHNGGDLNFGPDGMLYIGMGDGGSGNDPQERAQNLNDLQGKMLRIDVDGGSPYAVPADNPFVGINGADEIWAYGLRNPWRFSFDRLTGDMWIGDVGQNALEEVDFQPANSTGGENYGWDCYEANDSQDGNGEHPDCFDVQGNSLINHTEPAFEFAQNSSGGNSITGGYVYRGPSSHLQGHYFVIDYARDNVWTVQKTGDVFDVTAYGNMGVNNVSTFGEDFNGELYIAELFNGKIHQVTTTVLTTQLISFNGFYKNKQVELKWTSVANFKNSHFEIEKSANGTDFKNIGKVQVASTSNQHETYTFTDEQPVFSDLYYRLKMVEEDGSFEYSKSVVIYFNDQPELSIFPNPNQGSFNLLIKGQTDKAKSVDIIIRSLTGELVYRQKHLASLLPFDQQLFLENLPNGVYDVEVNFDGQILRHQMVKSK